MYRIAEQTAVSCRGDPITPIHNGVHSILSGRPLVNFF